MSPFFTSICFKGVGSKPPTRKDPGFAKMPLRCLIWWFVIFNPNIFNNILRSSTTFGWFLWFSSQVNIPVPWILWVWQNAMELLRWGCFLVVDLLVYPDILGELRSQGWCIFSTKWGAKEAQNPQNHRVAVVVVVEDLLGILPGPGTWCRFASGLEASSAKVPWFPRSWDA